MLKEFLPPTPNTLHRKRIPRRLSGVACAAGLLFAPTACATAEPAITEGTVIGHSYEPPRTETTMNHQKIGENCINNKIGTTTVRNCTPIYVTNPETHHVHARYLVKIRNCSAELKLPDDTCAEAEWDVDSRNEQLAYPIGSHFSVNPA